MARWISYLLVLCISSATVDAAMDVESLGGCDEQVAHEVHGEVADSLPNGASEDPTDPSDEQAAHFCHCAVHAPVLPLSAPPSVVPAAEASPSTSTHLYCGYRSPPPVRPPKLD